MAKDIIIYTDGGAQPNPGKGGYAIVMKYGEYVKEFYEGFQLTTNNRMELKAIIEALKLIKNKNLQVKIYSDSKYVVDAINLKWLDGWKIKKYAKTKNSDLWKEFEKIRHEYKLQFYWVKGHNGIASNERCDELVKMAFQQTDLRIDGGYEE